MQALLASAAPVCTVVGKTSDFHATQVLRVVLGREPGHDPRRVAYLVGSGREVVYDAEHFFDGWKSNPEYAAQTIRAAAEAGARLIVLCDTNGGSMPEEIADMTRQAVEAVREFGAGVGIHCHNDCDLAVANSLAAVDAGAVQVQGTINGFGERCGNADLISVIPNLALKKQGYEVLGGREPGAADGAVTIRLRDREHELPQRAAVRGSQRLCPQRRHARPRRGSRHIQLRAH